MDAGKVINGRSVGASPVFPNGKSWLNCRIAFTSAFVHYKQDEICDHPEFREIAAYEVDAAAFVAGSHST